MTSPSNSSDECFGKNYSSFLDFTRNYKWMNGILSAEFYPHEISLSGSKHSHIITYQNIHQPHKNPKPASDTY